MPKKRQRPWRRWPGPIFFGRGRSRGKGDCCGRSVDGFGIAVDFLAMRKAVIGWVVLDLDLIR